MSSTVTFAQVNTNILFSILEDLSESIKFFRTRKGKYIKVILKTQADFKTISYQKKKKLQLNNQYLLSGEVTTPYLQSDPLIY